jgi:general secretion pathway protein G
MVAFAIIATLVTIAVPLTQDYIYRAQVIRSVAEIKTMQDEIRLYGTDKQDKLPEKLADIGRGTLLDPWGNAYQYQNFAGLTGKGKMRKDQSLVPINSDFDLYSMGRDGETAYPLTAAQSHDDIVRANDGRYIGLASEY